MAANPDPQRISDPIWWLWTEFDALEPSALLGGVYAQKPGYHRDRASLPKTDYSTGRDVANDAYGPGTLSSAIDLTMSAAAMRLYTARLDKAARARDPRLYIAGEPILREFIGTLDGETVYCYVLTGGRALGVGADSGPDPGRDGSHLWHDHLSVIRKFLNSMQAMRQLMSILAGEALAAWKAREETSSPQEDDMNAAEMTAWANSAAGKAALAVAAGSGVHGQKIGKSATTIGMAFETLLVNAGVDEHAIIGGILAALNPQQIADLVVAAMPADQARRTADELAARLQS